MTAGATDMFPLSDQQSRPLQVRITVFKSLLGALTAVVILAAGLDNFYTIDSPTQTAAPLSSFAVGSGNRAFDVVASSYSAWTIKDSSGNVRYAAASAECDRARQSCVQANAAIS
ncbi:MAG: hypothetical protein ACC652_01250 [Acidimicrobiales bacterium]